MLAKLMAAENITVEHKKIPTAAFDVKNRILYLPILKWKPGSDVYDLFCAHEVGHALWTPYDGWHSSISEKGKGYKSFLNVIEDARIEKKIKRKFAGSRKCMLGGYIELMDEDFFGLRKMGVDANDLGLIDRINLYTKAGTQYSIDFTDEEREWVEKVMRTETWEDVVEVTDALYEWCKENESETDNSYGDFDENEEYDWNEDYDPDDYEEDGNTSPIGSDEKKSDDDSEKSEENKTNPSSKSNEDSDEEKDGSETSSNNFEGGKSDPFSDNRENFAGSSNDDNEPTSMTDEAFRENEKELSDMSDNVSIPQYLTFPKINTDSIVVDYKVIHEELNNYYNGVETAIDTGNEMLKKFKVNNGKMISYMVKEFEMKKAADIHRRAYSSKRGTLDMNKIHAYKYSDNIFRQITNLPEGKNHGMVMFIDWSGSMHGYMKDTIEQLINLTMFCQKVQIPFEVYAFTDHYRDYNCDNPHRPNWSRNSDSNYDESSAGKKISNYKKNDLIISQHLRLMTLFSSKMKGRELTEAYRNILLVGDTFSNYYGYRNNPYFGAPNNFSLSGTPLDATIICAKTIIEEFKTKTKAQIVNVVFLTDGQSNRHNEFLDSDGRTQHISRNNLHIDDPVTRTRVYPNRESGKLMDTTSIFLLALKKQLGINLLGFFLTSGSGRRTAGNMSYIMERYPRDEEITKFRKEKFLIETKTSYDELYIINTKGLEIDEVDHMDAVEVGSTKAQIRRALKKNTSGKLQNRMLLNAFIKKVA
tara:strand:- start:3923 stop:6196 length:2274 start_codon:yes stop_codon:yes gene_type:complete